MATSNQAQSEASSIRDTGPAAYLLEKVEAGEDIVVIDLFAGAGGMSTGAIRVLRRIADEVGQPVEEIAEVIAVNHWSCAIGSHSKNHSWATHFHSKIQELRPRDIVKDERTDLEEGDEIDLLIGCPDCTYFSSARGGGPKDPDSRATPREILDFVERLPVQNLLFENVPEFRNWGPLDADNKVIEEKKGEYFDNWVNALNIEGFAVDWEVLNTANYGDATSRRRLFVAGRKDNGVSWPDQTHSENGDVSGTEEWRTAADIIDWEDPGESLWVRDIDDGRRKPLKNSTMQRIAEGLRRHGNGTLTAFADAIENIGREEVYEMRENIIPASQATTVAESVSEPFLVKYYGTSTARPITGPLDTITSGGEKFALCVPSVTQPAPSTQSINQESLPDPVADGGITPDSAMTMVLGQQSNARPKPATENPLPTIATSGAISRFTAQPLVLPNNTSAQSAPEPYLIEYYGNGTANQTDEPLPTVTTKDRFALVVPELFPVGIDVKFRMLKPEELAAAMGFEGYEFVGNKTETVKQIGNAVPVNTAESLCSELLLGSRPTLDSFNNLGQGKSNPKAGA